ncbi:transporter substrate-binding domain-containing protein [Sabulicella rubraurantiaca]|uniref:transporter substrate-binding domain-containing protein n=1 Tax=Sabulicella rubraurantiaca TaxID=2811429 RepID=UPI001A972D74|nr:transporter substrate-binding domain-containing protein [Sabulicella rubraurantiaca]
MVLASSGGAALASVPEVARMLAPTGRLRLGVYPGSPTSLMRGAQPGEERGLTMDIGRELARRLGVPFERVEFPRVAEVLRAVAAGEADFTISNATPARAREVDFARPLISIELGFLVPAGSPVSAIADLDRPGIRIGVVQGSTSERVLPREMRAASVVAAPNLREAAQMLSSGALEAFATNKAVLFEMSDNLPGARILDGRWGVEHLAMAIPKGRDEARPYIESFAEDVKASGLLARAVERAGLRGWIPAG